MTLGGRCIVLIFGTLSASPAGSQALPAGPADPAAARYIVEVLIFRHIEAPAEIGDPDAAPSAMPTFGDELPAKTEPGPVAPEAAPELIYAPLPAENFALGAVEKRLRGSSAYEPLLHIGWIQESFPAAEAPAFRLDEHGRRDLSGTVKFSRGRFPHLELDLSYRPEALAFAHPGWEGYPLREYRRIREDEDHYFDNAHFGAIARVSPHEPEVQDSGEDAAGIEDPVSAPR